MARAAIFNIQTLRAPMALIILSLVILAASAPVRPAVAQATPPTATITPQADARPDSCEPNNDQAHACRIALDTVSGPFTFLPEGDVDVYSVFLGAQPDGMQTTITLRATSGLDLYTTVSRAEGGAALATIASPTISTTLAADVTGWAVLRVENRGAAIATGQSYRVELRRTLPPAPTAVPTASGPEGLARDPATPDALENNWSPETAAPIAVGVIYDLNFVCPAINGCPGGDHDYLRFEVKSGGDYLISTFDLADGVDTVIDLFWWHADVGWQLLTSNDDARAGTAFLSTIRWRAPADGIALIRVGPRSGGLNPILSGAPSYRLAIALAGSPLSEQLEARIATQTNQPTPTAAAAAVPTPGSTNDGPAPAAPAAPTAIAITSDATSGAALVTVETSAHTDPDAASPILGSIPVDALVQLTGRVAGLWVEVETPAIVGAAWVDRRVLRPTAPLAPTETRDTAGSGDTTDLPPIPDGTASLPPPASGTAHLPPIPDGTASLPPPASGTAVPLPITAQVRLQVFRGDQPVRGMRVILMNVFDDVLGQQVTADDGTVVFDVQVARGMRVDLVIPALGLRAPVDAANPAMIVTIPVEAI